MEKELKNINIEDIVPNLSQPRTHFDIEAIDELAKSIQENGLIQPLVVRPIEDGKYEIVAGERRFRACTKAMMTSIPCIIEEYDDQHLAQAALIENIQREDLTPIEEAKSYKYLMETHNMTQQEIADQVGKKQSTIANKLRLLNLPVQIQDAVNERRITERHARALLSIDDSKKQVNMLKKIEDKGLNVKQTEELINKDKPKKKKSKLVKKGISKQAKIAINTFHQAIDMVTKTGLTVDVDEEENDDYYIMTLKIKK